MGVPLLEAGWAHPDRQGLNRVGGSWAEGAWLEGALLKDSVRALGVQRELEFLLPGLGVRRGLEHHEPLDPKPQTTNP